MQDKQSRPRSSLFPEDARTKQSPHAQYIYDYSSVRYVLEYSSIGYNNTGNRIACLYAIIHSIPVLDMYLIIQVLGTCMSGIYTAPQYATLHSKYKSINNTLVY